MKLPSRDTICVSLSLNDLPETERTQITTDVERNILASILLEILTKLPPDAQEAFKRAYREGNEEQAYAVCTPYIPHITEFIESKGLAALDELRTAIEH